MKKTVYVISLVTVLAVVLSTVAFAQGGYVKPTFVKKTPPVIGYSVYDMLQPYWQAYAKGVQDAATAAGYGFQLSDQKSSQQTEVSGSIDLINKGVSALINSPVEPSALPAVIDAAHKAQIPVVIGDVGVAGDYDAFVLSDNEGGGKLAAAVYREQAGRQAGRQGSPGHLASPRLGGRSGACEGLRR